MSLSPRLHWSNENSRLATTIQDGFAMCDRAPFSIPWSAEEYDRVSAALPLAQPSIVLAAPIGPVPPPLFPEVVPAPPPPPVPRTIRTHKRIRSPDQGDGSTEKDDSS